jgi:predicted permease
VTLLKEDSRASWGWHWLECLLQDLGYAERILRRNPGFALVAVLTLALGIGANCLIFSVVDTVLLRPFPYKNPDRLVFVWTEFNAPNRAMSSLPDYLDWRARNQVFEDMGAWIPTSFDLAGPDYPEQLHGRRASASFFRTLGVQPQLGRLFLPDEEREGRDRVVLLGDALWRNRFNADERAVGSTILLRRNAQPAEPYTIIGVLPATFQAAFPRYADIWGALALDGEEAQQRRRGGFDVMARLKPGITSIQAESAMRSIAYGLALQYPKTNRGYSVQLRDFHESLTGYGRQTMWSLMGAVAFVLLIACVNVANLMLARAADREREMMIRAAIGAGRGRLCRQLLAEFLLLCVLGGAAGALLAGAGVSAARAAMPAGILRRGEIAIDLRVLAFTFAVSLLAGVAFGLIPAWRGSRAGLSPAARGSGGRNRTGLRNSLVVAEIALGLVLVTGAALTINSFVRLLRVDPGFDPRRLLSIETHLPREEYRSDAARLAVTETLLARVKLLPGVAHAGITDFRPLGNSMDTSMRKRMAGAQPLAVNLETIAGDYFAAMGTRLLRGRAFTEHDNGGAPAVAIINEAAARRYWPGEDPLGQQVLFGRAQRGEARAIGEVTEGVREIVGVVADVRRMGLDRAAEPAMYVPQWQEPSTRLEIVLRMRPGVSAADLARAVRTELAAAGRTLVVSEVTTMEEVVSQRLSQPRFLTSLLGIFGLVALALVITGVYGVTAYTVRVRTYEIGIRMALGAARRDVLAALLGRGVRLAGVGIALGAVGAFAVSRALTSALYEVKPADPSTFIAAALLVAAASLLASYLPARRAARIDPMQALRHE